jgi:hypothetical protein
MNLLNSRDWKRMNYEKNVNPTQTAGEISSLELFFLAANAVRNKSRAFISDELHVCNARSYLFISAVLVDSLMKDIERPDIIQIKTIAYLLLTIQIILSLGGHEL